MERSREEIEDLGRVDWIVFQGICSGFGGSVSEMGWFLGFLQRLSSAIVEVSGTTEDMTTISPVFFSFLFFCLEKGKYNLYKKLCR